MKALTSIEQFQKVIDDEAEMFCLLNNGGIIVFLGTINHFKNTFFDNAEYDVVMKFATKENCCVFI